MNVTVETLAPCKKLMRVDVDVQAVDKSFDDVAKNFQKEVALPGFRAGKAPFAMVTKRFETQIQEEVKKKLIGDSYRQAVKDQKLNVVGYPDIEEIQFGKGQTLQFAATIETAPDFELPEYKGVAVKRESTDVSDAEISGAIDRLRDRGSQFNTVARAALSNDLVVVNYSGTVEGKPITEIAPASKGLTEQKNFWISADGEGFIPGFGNQLQGTSAGDKKTIEFEFPAEFVQPLLSGKKGTYEVEVVEVKEKILPELNDEFAKTLGTETVDKLRDAVRLELQNDRNGRQKRGIRDQLIKHVLDSVKCELPDGMVNQETRNLVYNIVNENQRRGVPKETIEAQKNDIFQSATITARERVKASFIFGRIAEKEGVKVEQIEMVQRIQAMAAQYQTTPEKLAKDLQENGGINQVAEQVLHEKVLELLAQNAKYEDVAATPAA